jgi:uncharacterized protein YbjT (DUF2867 family)
VVLSEGTRNLIAAMQRHGVERFVCQSAFGVGDSYALTGWLFRHVILRLLRAQYEDKHRQEEVVRRSPLQWTLVRPTRLVDGPRADRTHVLTERGRLVEAISRADVAAFLLATVENGEHIGRAVTITTRRG